MSHDSSSTSPLSIPVWFMYINLAGTIWSFIPNKLCDYIIYLLMITAEMVKKLSGRCKKPLANNFSEKGICLRGDEKQEEVPSGGGKFSL